MLKSIKIESFEAEYFLFICAADVTRSSDFRKKSKKMHVTLFSPFHIYDLPLTSRRRPTTSKKRDDDTHQPWRLAPTTTALTQQPTRDSRCAGVYLPRGHCSINRRRRIDDCSAVASVITHSSGTSQRSWIHRDALVGGKILDYSLLGSPRIARGLIHGQKMRSKAVRYVNMWVLGAIQMCWCE